MKLYTSDHIRMIDQYSIDKGTSSTELIQRAANAFVHWLIHKVSLEKLIVTFCCTGSNGADGLEISYQLKSRGFNVKIFCIERGSSFSKSYFIFKNKCLQAQMDLVVLDGDLTPPAIASNCVIVDAMLGNGLSRPLDQEMSRFIDKINQSGLEVYAVDVPTGMSSDGQINGTILRCKAALSFEFPKLSFLARESEKFLKKWDYAPISLSESAKDQIRTPYHMIKADEVKAKFQPRPPHSYKNNYGHALLVGGQPNMAGAILLTAKACVRSGAGLTTIGGHPHNRIIFLSALPQAMFISLDELETGSKTIGIGPGLGTNEKSLKQFTHVLSKANTPMVIDADGLNLLAQNEYLWHTVPHGSIITPHVGEFHKLFGNCSSDYDRWQTQRARSQELGIIIILKGRYSSISDPSADLYFNRTGNPGMASGGSGDVLTGIITALLAQGYAPLDAATLGVYIHGRSGDLAASQIGQTGLSALDICDYLPLAFKELE